MEPALIALLVIGIPLGAWATYEGIEYVREWLSRRQERRTYENYVRVYSQEKSRYTSDDDNEQMLLKDIAFTSGWTRVSDGKVRNRESHRGWEHYKISEQDLLAMEYQFEKLEDWPRQKQPNSNRADLMQMSSRDISVQARGNRLMGLVDNDNSISILSPSMLPRNSANPPSMQEQPLPSPECAVIHPSSNDDEDHFLMPAPPQCPRRDTDDSAASYCWANSHSREHSNESDVSYSSLSSSSSSSSGIGASKSESSASLSYGVRSITSDDVGIA